MSFTDSLPSMDMEWLQQKGAGTFWDYIGCKPIKLTVEEAIAEMEIQPHHLNVMGVVHGGVYASMLDSVMGVLAMYLRPGLPVVTGNLNLHFTAPAAGSKIRVFAHPIHQSKRTITVEGRVLDGDDQLCAFATGTFRVVGSGRRDGDSHQSKD